MSLDSDGKDISSPISSTTPITNPHMPNATVPPPNPPPSSVVPPTPEAEAPPPSPRLFANIFGLPDTLKTLSNLGVAKCKVNPAQGILMGWQAMAYLAFAALFSFIIMAAVATDLSPGLGRFLMFLVFPGTALVAVIIFGANLVTGDYMTSGISLMARQAKWREGTLPMEHNTFWSLDSRSRSWLDDNYWCKSTRWSRFRSPIY